MRTDTITIYTARELREHCPDGFRRAMGRHVERVWADHDWAGEHRDSLDAAVHALEDAGLPDIEGPRRVMAWLENHVLGPLRIPWRSDRRWALSRFGSFYRAGTIQPCPWTGYCVDDDLIDCMVESARLGERPTAILRIVQARADALWQSELECQCTEAEFFDRADANELEFTADGMEV